MSKASHMTVEDGCLNERVADMGMTKPQPCVHHKDADPAKVPTGEVEAVEKETTGPYPGKPIIEDTMGLGPGEPCGPCWQCHAEWQKETYEQETTDQAWEIEDLLKQLATAKADTERLAKELRDMR